MSLCDEYFAIHFWISLLISTAFLFNILLARLCLQTLIVISLLDMSFVIGYFQRPFIRLLGIPAVDWTMVRLLVSGAGSDGCKLPCAVLYTLHGRRLCGSHQLYLHLWRIQENAKACPPLSYWHRLPLGHGHSICLPLHASWGYVTMFKCISLCLFLVLVHVV